MRGWVHGCCSAQRHAGALLPCSRVSGPRVSGRFSAPLHLYLIQLVQDKRVWRPPPAAGAEARSAATERRPGLQHPTHCRLVARWHTRSRHKLQSRPAQGGKKTRPKTAMDTCTPWRRLPADAASQSPSAAPRNLVFFSSCSLLALAHPNSKQQQLARALERAALFRAGRCPAAGPNVGGGRRGSCPVEEQLFSSQQNLTNPMVWALARGRPPARLSSARPGPRHHRDWDTTTLASCTCRQRRTPPADPTHKGAGSWLLVCRRSCRHSTPARRLTSRPGWRCPQRRPAGRQRQSGR